MYWLLLLIPILVAWGAKFFFHATITWKEMAVQMAASSVIVVIVLATGLYSQTDDVEIWNGEITDKQKVRVSCEHSYQCNCVTVSCGKDCTTTICQTCYDHSYDNDWRVYNNIDSSFNIRREDRQGLKTPKRWTQVKIGEPYSSEHHYVNYIKAVPESIFGSDLDKLEGTATLVLPYPRVYDYYYVKRVMSNGVPVKNLNKWNDDLNHIAKTLGSRKRVNPIIQFVKTDDPSYQFDLERRWLNGKKNDIIVVFGVKKYPKIDFVRIVGWENEEIKLHLRTALEMFDTINDEYEAYAMATIKENINLYFKKMTMEDYEYLKDQIEPPLWVIVLAFILAVLSSCGITYYMHKNDVFGDENSGSSYPYSRRPNRPPPIGRRKK